jgi:hypothetical protein
MLTTKVKCFSYLGTILNSKNMVREEINRRIMAGNRAYFASVKLLKSTLLSRHSNVKLYKTFIRPVETCGAETWIMSAADENALRVFERKVVRGIYDPVREGERWRIRSNRELEEILRGEDTVTFVKSQRLAWLGRVERMEEERMSRKLLHGKMEGRRRRGRPRKRWLHDLQEDLRVMQVGMWWEKAQGKEEWRRIVGEAEAHLGLQCRGRIKRRLFFKCMIKLYSYRLSFSFCDLTSFEISRHI